MDFWLPVEGHPMCCICRTEQFAFCTNVCHSCAINKGSYENEQIWSYARDTTLQPTDQEKEYSFSSLFCYESVFCVCGWTFTMIIISLRKKNLPVNINKVCQLTLTNIVYWFGFIVINASQSQTKSNHFLNSKV